MASAGSVLFSAAQLRQTPDGSSYHTDGLRDVLMFGGEAVSLAEVVRRVASLK